MNEMRHYLLLISASKDNITEVRSALDRIKRLIDTNASPLWVDSKGLGVFVATDKVSAEIWNSTFTGGSIDFDVFSDALIVELGSDWAARRDAKPGHWLTTHLGHPLPRPRR